MASLLNMSGGNLLKKGLPYDAEIEYLESSGTQYIDTGIYPDASYTFNSEVWIIKGGETIFWGARHKGIYSTLNAQCLLDYPNNGVTKYTRYINLYSTTVFYADENWHTDFIPQVNVKYNLDNMTVVSTMETMTKPIFLFGYNNLGDTYLDICRLGEWIAFSNSKIVAHFIPVRIGNVGYLYDKVSKQLFGNSGTGDFILGPDKTN